MARCSAHRSTDLSPSPRNSEFLCISRTPHNATRPLVLAPKSVWNVRNVEKRAFLERFLPHEMASADSQDGKIDLGDWGVCTKLFIAVLIMVIEYKRRRLLINEI